MGAGFSVALVVFMVLTILLFVALVATLSSFELKDSTFAMLFILGMIFNTFVAIVTCLNVNERSQLGYTFITIDDEEKTNGHDCSSYSMTCKIDNTTYKVKKFEPNEKK